MAKKLCRLALLSLFILGLGVACKHVPPQATEDLICGDGEILRFGGNSVGCLYRAGLMEAEVGAICPPPHTSFTSDRRGVEVDGSAGDAILLDCLICIHEGHSAARNAIQSAGSAPPGFSPGVRCAGIFEEALPTE